MEVMKEASGCKTIIEKSCATVMSIGEDYWFKSHIDRDFHLTTMRVLAPEFNNEDKALECKNKDETIIYYFIFPTYRIAVPLRSSDIILFYPMIMNFYLNPTYSGSCIVLAYVSCKTVLCADTNKFDTNH